MAPRFDGKAIIITGAGSGLGRDAAVRLASEGAGLVLVDLSSGGLEETKALVAQVAPGAHVELIAGDVTDSSIVESYVAKAQERFGAIHGFFNNAGIEGKQNLTENFGDEEFLKVVGINLNAVFFGMKAVLKVMHEQGFGSIVNTASVGGIRGVGNQSGYAASKHGVVGLTRNSAREYGEFGIRINAIAPGAILTAMVENSLKQIGGEDGWEEAGRQFVSVNPTKRLGRPEEVSAVVAFLLADESSFINGTVIPIDGGQHAMY